MVTQAHTLPTVRHPLEPLSAEELHHAVSIMQGDARFQALGDRVRFSSIALHEPPKDLVLGFVEGQSWNREAFLILLNRADSRTYEAAVSLSADRVVSLDYVPSVQPPPTLEEIVEAEALVKAHPEFQRALRRRGIIDAQTVVAEIWCPGNFGLPIEQERRLGRAIAYVRQHPTDNFFAHPLEGLIVLVDLQRMEVLEVQDHDPIPAPPQPGNYTVDAVGALRQDLQALQISQPQGPSFRVDGYAVQWQKWQMRLGFTPREGLVLHTLGYEDGGRVRPILYRAALSEMVVPYGDPGPHHYFKNAFDAGELNLGASVQSLEWGCDCLGEIHYFDVAMADETGAVQVKRNIICMHEEDYGVLWRHYDWRSNTTEVRRSRRLVISFVVTLGNYDYAFAWYLYQDGTIEHQVKLTGVLLTGAVAQGILPRYGTLIAPGLQAVYHQHFFNIRMDMQVDGPCNRVYEVHTESTPPGPENPYGNAFGPQRTLLAKESEAQQLIDPLRARCWEVVNPSVKNSIGQPVAYRLVPGENVLPFAQPDASVTRRAGFITRHLWVTPYMPEERYAAGDYPNQHPGGAGLPAYTQADRAITDTNVVLWYTFGSHHLPRPEDWPVMPTASIGFMLKPVGFFDRNPALDVPPPTSHEGNCHAG